MTSPDRRVELMREEGVEQVLILPFTPEVARLSPEEFVRRMLVERLGARAVLVGDNFRFGHRHAGNVANCWPSWAGNWDSKPRSCRWPPAGAAWSAAAECAS